MLGGGAAGAGLVRTGGSMTGSKLMDLYEASKLYQ
jgi:hypothetical protein